MKLGHGTKGVKVIWIKGWNLFTQVYWNESEGVSVHLSSSQNGKIVEDVLIVTILQWIVLERSWRLSIT